MINLGDRVRCKITGYSGIAVSRTEHLYSSNVEIGVEQETLKDGFPVQPVWFSEKRLELFNSKSGTTVGFKTGDEQ